MALQIVSTRNGVSPVTGYREDLVAGDLISLALSSTVGVTQVRWELLGRPEGSAAGGAGPEPILLPSGLSTSFTVDSDSGDFRLDGSYKVQATINPGSPGERRVDTILCRLAGVTIPGPASSVRLLRKLAGFEALEDTSLPEVLQGWATQLNRWLELLRGVATGGAGGFTTLEGAYAHGATSSDQTLVLHDAVGGAVIIDATQGDFTGASAFKVTTPSGGPFVVDRATGRVGLGTAAPAKSIHIASTAPAVRLDRSGGVALDVANVGDELQFLNGGLVLAKLEPTGGLRADLGVGIGVAPATASVLALGAASTAAVSGAGTARFRYNEVTGHAEWSENGGPYQPFISSFSAYTTVADAGSTLAQRTVLNAARPLVATDNAGASRTDLSLSIDGTLGVTGGALSRAALTGDVTAAAGSNATAFRSFTGASVLARAAGTSGAPADLAATVDGQVLQRAAGALSWAPLAYSSLTGIPTFFYQTMSAAGVALTQRVALNADGTVVMSDDVADGWTTIGLPHVGPGAQTVGGNGVSSVSFDDYGRITGATAASYLSTINGIMAGGDLTGSYPNPQLAPKGATVGQALVWDGTGWNPGTVATTAFYQTMQTAGVALTQRNALNADGTIVMVDDPSNSWTTIGLPFILPGQTFGGTGIASLTVDNYGRVTGAVPGRFLSTITGIMAGGDLSGSYPNPQIDQKGATAGQALIWSGAGWSPATIAPAGPANTAAYFDGSGVLAGAADQVANIAALEALPGANYRDGARVRTSSLNDDFFFHVSNSLTVDDIKVASVSGMPGARWIRREGGRRADWSTTYFVDSIGGNDQADGVTSGTQLKTAAELGRRIKDSDLSGAVTITVTNDLPDSDPITVDISPVSGVPGLSIIGSPTVAASGLIASATAANYGANQLNQVTITGFNWAPYVGSIVRLQGTSGDTGTYAVVVHDLGSGSALLGVRIVNLSPNGGTSFTAGQTIEVLSYPKIPGLFVSGALPLTIAMRDVRVALSSPGTIRLSHSSVNSTLTMIRCVVDGGGTSGLNSTLGTLSLNISSIRSLTTASIRGLQMSIGAALVGNGQTTITNSVLSSSTPTWTDSITWGSPVNFGDFANVVLTTRVSGPPIGVGVFGLSSGQIGIQTGRQASLYADWFFGGSNDPASYGIGLSRNAKFTSGNFFANSEASSAGAIVGYSNPQAPASGSQAIPMSLLGSTASINSIDRGAGPNLAAASQIAPLGLTMFRSWSLTGTASIIGMYVMPSANGVPAISQGLSIELAIHDGVTLVHDSHSITAGYAPFNLADGANETLPAGSRIRLEYGLNAAGTNTGWVETWRSTVGGDLTGSMPNPIFRNFAGTSVLANATGAPARPTDLAATADGQVLQRVSGALVWAPAFYQTVVVGSTTETQRLQLGFSTAFTGTDSSSPSRTTIGLAATGVTAGSYTNASITVLADGRISVASSGAGGASFYQTVSSNGSALAQRGTLNFSTAFSVADNVGAGRTDVSLATNGTTLTNLQQIAANSILMNPTAAPANVQAISLGTTSGVLQYVNGTTDSFGVYAAGVSRIPFGSGGSGQLTDDAHMKFNGFTFGVTSQQELQLYNDGTGASDFTGVRLGTASNFSRSFYFQQLGQSVTSGAGLAPNNGLLELNASTATLVISNIGGGDISIATGASRTSRIDVTAGGNVQVSSLSSGGVVKAAVTTGQLSIASAGTDYVQTVSVSALQLVNGGTSANPVLGLATTGASGSYTNANITVDLWGRITAASSGSAGAAFYQTVENAATGLAQRAALNFSTGLTAVDNAGAGRTDVTANLSTGISGGQSVIGGTAASEALTLTSTASGTKGKINIGSSGSVGVIDENAGLVAIGQLTPDGRIHVVMPDDTGLGSTTAWNSSFAVFGRSGANAGSLGVSTTVGSTSVNLSALAPSNAWWNMRINAHTLAVYADGSTLGFSQDASANVTIARALTLTSITGPALLWVSAIGGVGTVTGPQSATLAYDYNLCDFTGIGKTNAGLFSGATQAYGVLGAGPLFMSTSGASTSTCEYGLNVSATTIAVRAHVVRNDLSGGTGTMQWNVTRNGAATTTTLFITEGAGTQDVVVTGTVSGSASDTWGLDFTNGTGATGGAFTGSVTLTVSAV